MKHWIPALLALVTFAFVTNAHAACEANKRHSPQNANCLEASHWYHGTSSWTRIYKWKARNTCKWLGKVVAKIDVAHASDQTVTLPYGDGDWHEGQVNNEIRSVKCCTDLSDMCNREDIVTDANCLDRWRESDAHEWIIERGSCPANNTTATAKPDTEECHFQTTCIRDDLLPWERVQRQIQVHYHDVWKVDRCAGQLRPNNGCD